MARRRHGSRSGKPGPRGRRVDVSKTALGKEPEKRGRSDDAERPAPSDRNDLKVRVKTARGRKLSSTRWLERQLNDPFVAKAKAAGYRSRAAFKLLEIDQRFGLMKPGGRVVDLGAAPGGWAQAAVRAVGPRGQVVGVDLVPIEPVAGAQFLRGDFLDDAVRAQAAQALGGPADAVLSDMAASASGHRGADHLRIIALCEAALDFAEDVLAPGGAFCAKVLRGGAEGELLARMKRAFTTVKHMKPQASRSESSEIYVVAQGFRGAISPSDQRDGATGG